MRVVWSGRVASLVMAVCAACGGKAEKDGPVVESPRASAGAAGAATASGGSGGASATTRGGAPPTGGVVAAGGVVAVGGSAGLAATGGVSPIPEPGTELWFSRGYTVLESDFYDRLLSNVFDVPPAEPGKATPWAFLGQSLVLTAQTLPASADEVLRVTAEQFVARLSDAELLGPLGCGGDVADPSGESCAESVSTRFARRMWRREVAPSESAELMAVFAEAAPGAETDALRQMVRSILTTRDAYALPTLGTAEAGGKYRLTDLELAGLLAVGITGMPPDDELLETALAGELDVRSEAERALASDTARTQIATLISRWFHLHGPEHLWVYAEQPELALSMYEETRRFIEDVVFDEPKPVSSLMTADFSFVDSSLAELYGLDSPEGPGYERVDLSSTRRRGIPGQASFLVTVSFDGGRHYPGRAVYPLQLICENLPPPPLGVIAPPPQPSGGSFRERFEVITTTDPVCAGCHRIMNPVAFAFEHFDENGRYVEIDETGLPIDSSGSVTTFGGNALEFADSAELTQQMSELPAYSECFARKAAGFFTGLGDADPAVLDYVARGHERGDDAQVLAVIRKFLNSDHFRYRKQ